MKNTSDFNYLPSHLTVAVNRRQILQTLSLFGVGTATFHRALADEAAKSAAITIEQIASAEWIAGITLSDEQRAALQNKLNSVQKNAEQIRTVPIGYDAIPSFRFDPEMADSSIRSRAAVRPEWLTKSNTEPAVTEAADGLSFLSIQELGRQLRSGQLTSVRLTRHCLDQLLAQDPVLSCVVTLTEELALRQAEQADAELAAGHDRGPLHGIPWGAKDLIAVSGYPTTWGAPQFRDRQIETTATVANRLEAAGAVLVAKLSLGALAMGDQWFMGQTKNPWNVEQGSSGSSAGSASAVAAGLLPFTIGSETLGSIISPTRRCGVTGLRPTFGRVSRAGCMALSWTMDKIGPIARSTDDCGFVFAAIHGRDHTDPTTVDCWFEWPTAVDFSRIRIGRVTNATASPPDQAALDILQDLGVTLVEIELPRDIPEWSLASMLDVEAACIFQKLTRTGNVEGLNTWPNTFRAAHFVSAVDYLQASRVRLELMKRMAAVFSQINLYVGGDDLGITNLTGHPTLSLPVMMAEMQPQRRPLCCTLTAGLYDEASLLAVGRILEQKADVLKHRPQM